MGGHRITSWGASNDRGNGIYQKREQPYRESRAPYLGLQLLSWALRRCHNQDKSTPPCKRKVHIIPLFSRENIHSMCSIWRHSIEHPQVKTDVIYDRRLKLIPPRTWFISCLFLPDTIHQRSINVENIQTQTTVSGRSTVSNVICSISKFRLTSKSIIAPKTSSYEPRSEWLESGVGTL